MRARSNIVTPPSRRTTGAFLGAVSDYVGLWVALGALILTFSVATDHFFSATNFRIIANQVPSAVLVATGMTLVLMLGQIDLSVGSVLALTGSVLGVAMTQWHWSLAFALPAALVTGVLCGLFNGVVSITWRLPSFIVTLGMLEIARGAAHALTHSQTQYIGAAIEGFSAAHWLGFSMPAVLAVILVGAGQVMLHRTVFGRHLVAIGTNEEAARLSGIDPRPVKVAVFAATGLLAALAAVIDASRFQSADPNAGMGLELQAIAAAVIGGTSLMGGRGSVIRTFLGVLIMAVLNSGLAAVGARDEMKRLITGAVIITAVILDAYRRR